MARDSVTALARESRSMEPDSRSARVTVTLFSVCRRRRGNTACQSRLHQPSSCLALPCGHPRIECCTVRELEHTVGPVPLSLEPAAGGKLGHYDTARHVTSSSLNDKHVPFRFIVFTGMCCKGNRCCWDPNII